MIGLCCMENVFKHYKLTSVAIFRTLSSECESKITKKKSKADITSKHTKKKKVEVTEAKNVLYNKYSKSLWNKCSQNRDYYIWDENVAREIGTIISEKEKDVITFEVNPGPGILTEALLKAGLSKVCAFEKEAAFLQNLQSLGQLYPDKLEIVERDILLKLSELHLLTEKTEKKQWKDGIALKIILTLSSSRSINFMRHIFAKLSSMSSLFYSGRCQFYVLMNDQEFSYMNAKPKDKSGHYRNISVLYSIFFDIDYYKKFPSTMFIPHRKVSSKKKASQTNHLHFVKLTPKADLLESVAPKRRLPDLYFFICHHMTKRRDHVIRSLEQWIPFCGPKFIRKGMHVFTKFGDLNPAQILCLFQQFSSLPEYDGSPFRAAVKQTCEHGEHSVIKM